nr:hypothetical protein [Tanacetum cinerariifolium]
MILFKTVPEVVNGIEDKDPYHLPDELKQLEDTTHIFQYHFGKGARPGQLDFRIDTVFKPLPPPSLALPTPEMTTPAAPEINQQFTPATAPDIELEASTPMTEVQVKKALTDRKENKPSTKSFVYLAESCASIGLVLPLLEPEGVTTYVEELLRSDAADGKALLHGVAERLNKLDPNSNTDIIVSDDIDDFTKGIELGKYPMWLELTRENRKEVLDIIGDIWDALVDVTRANSSDLMVSKSTKLTSYAGAAGASAKDQPKFISNFRPLVADPVFDGVNISIPRKVVKKVNTRLEHTLLVILLEREWHFWLSVIMLETSG